MNPFLIRMLSRNRTPIILNKTGDRKAPRSFWLAIAMIAAVLAIGLAAHVLREKPDHPATTVNERPASPDRTNR